MTSKAPITLQAKLIEWAWRYYNGGEDYQKTMRLFFVQGVIPDEFFEAHPEELPDGKSV